MERLLALVTCLHLGAASCFSRGTDWPDDPGLVALSRTIVGGAALGWEVYWVMYGALVAGLSIGTHVL